MAQPGKVTGVRSILEQFWGIAECVHLSVGEIVLVKLTGEQKQGATGRVNQSVSSWPTKIYRVLMRGNFFRILL